MDGGFILIHRKIRDWQWYRVDYMYYFFTELLFMANYEDKKWKTIDVPRGSFITSLRHLSGITGLTLDQVRTAISRLEESGEITHKSTHHFTMITIVKYDSYQIRKNLNPTPNPISIPSQSQQLNKVIKEIKENTNEQFEEFWNLYGKKIDRSKCYNWYKKNGSNGTHEKVMEGLNRWKQSGQWDDPQYQPYPYTFLFNKRYEDEPPKKLSLIDQLREQATKRFLKGEKT